MNLGAVVLIITPYVGVRPRVFSLGFLERRGVEVTRAMMSYDKPLTLGNVLQPRVIV